MEVPYFVKGDGTVDRGTIHLTLFAADIFGRGKIRKEDVLRALDEKYLAIDGLLRGLEEVVLNGIKALTTVLLY